MMTDETRIADFPASSYLPPRETIADAAKLPWEHVLVVGYDAEGDLMHRSSRMSRQDILWLIESLKRELWA